MKSVFISFLGVLLLASCKSGFAPKIPGETTYKEFSKAQKSHKTKDGKIAYVDKGSGPVLLLLHGVPTSSWLYRNMIDELVAGGYRVIVPDMLGFGNSDSPKGYDLYHPEAHAQRLIALMDHLKIDHWTQVFHDAGGLWTWELMKVAPERVDKLVILNTIIYPPGFQPPIRFKRGFFAKLAMSLYSNGISTDVMLKQLFKDGLMENNLTKVSYQGYKKPLLAGQTKAMYTFFSSTCNNLPDYSDIIRTIDKPIMLVWGKYDKFLVIENMRDEVIKDLHIQPENVHMLEAKHFIQEEKPREIDRLILGFVGEE